MFQNSIWLENLPKYNSISLVSSFKILARSDVQFERYDRSHKTKHFKVKFGPNLVGIIFEFKKPELNFWPPLWWSKSRQTGDLFSALFFLIGEQCVVCLF
jgi:hypothetical protein